MTGPRGVEEGAQGKGGRIETELFVLIMAHPQWSHLPHFVNITNQAQEVVKVLTIT